MNAPVSNEALLTHLRAKGWAVAVHNDYRIDNVPHTFWLFAHGCLGIWAKGEGHTDHAALVAATADAEARVAAHNEVTVSLRDARHLAARVIAEIRLSTRWPCPDCGREGPEAPLRVICIQNTDGMHNEVGPKRYTGCWRCNEGDRLVALAEKALAWSVP